MPKAIAQFQRVHPLPFGVPAGSVVLRTRSESPRSITIDAVAVVRDIVASGMKTPHQRLFFYDHAGYLDEVVVEHGEFVDFKTWTPEAPAPESVGVTPETTLREAINQIADACRARGVRFTHVTCGIQANDKGDDGGAFYVGLHTVADSVQTFYGRTLTDAINGAVLLLPALPQ